MLRSGQWSLSPLCPNPTVARIQSGRSQRALENEKPPFDMKRCYFGLEGGDAAGTAIGGDRLYFRTRPEPAIVRDLKADCQEVVPERKSVADHQGFTALNSAPLVLSEVR